MHSVLPKRGVLTRGVWDAIAAAPLLQGEVDTARRILLLGVGGGSVLRLWDHILRRWSWVGVELDPSARRLFRREFGLPEAPGELHAGDALAYLRSTRRRLSARVSRSGATDARNSGFRPTVSAMRCWASTALESLGRSVWMPKSIRTSRPLRPRSRNTPTERVSTTSGRASMGRASRRVQR